MFRGLDAQRLVALFFAGLALLNFPLLALWDHDVYLWGLPLFPSALFVLWAVLIAALAWVVERGRDRHTAED
jgi:membrane protein implicated in regulation of membrane protease activity